MTVKIFKILILGMWAVFFILLMTIGQKHLAYLLNPNLWWLVICAALIFLVFIAVNCGRATSNRQENSFFWQFPSLIILLIPLFFFFQFKDARFDTDTFRKRSISTAEGFRQSERVVSEPKNQEDSSETSLTELNFNNDKYLGKEVEAVCQTFADDRLPEGIVMCYRYLMTCCAADAMPIFVFIEHSENVVIENDKWIRVKGVLSMKKNSGVEVPLISLDSLEYVEEPSFPYLF